jgi:lysyl-tRNA synthetase class 1
VWDRLLDHAIAYYRDVVKPALQYRRPSGDEAAALQDLAESLKALPESADGETIQTTVYEVGKRHPVFAGLKGWFQSLYQILLGQNQGPRMGSFIALYGLAKAIALIERAARGEDLAGEAG